MKRSIFLLNLFLLTSIWAFGQAALGITRMANFPDTVRSGDNLAFVTAIVENTGDSTVPPGTSVAIMMRVNGQDLLEIGTAVTDSFLNPGDSFSVGLDSFRITPQFSIGGVNIIVVWPEANSIISDSLKKEFYVHYALGLKEPSANHFYRIFPVPVKDKLYLDLSQANSSLERVRILNMAGQILINTASQVIDVRDLPAGVYVFETRLKNGELITRKFLKIE